MADSTTEPGGVPINNCKLINYLRAFCKSLVKNGRSRILLRDGPRHGVGDHLLTNEHVAENLSDGHLLVCNKIYSLLLLHYAQNVNMLKI
jgi:hypothetical protein